MLSHDFIGIWPCANGNIRTRKLIDCVPTGVYRTVDSYKWSQFLPQPVTYLRYANCRLCTAEDFEIRLLCRDASIDKYRLIVRKVRGGPIAHWTSDVCEMCRFSHLPIAEDVNTFVFTNILRLWKAVLLFYSSCDKWLRTIVLGEGQVNRFKSI